MRICLFTDTIGDLNGVSRFIQDMAEQSLLHDLDIQVISSTAKYCPKAVNIHNFKPLFKCPMPFYKELDIAIPCKKIIKNKIKELNPDMIHISTPGAVGFLGLKIAKELNIPYTGTYHTDFPAYIKDNTGSKSLKKLTDKIMANFYKDFKLLLSRSKEYIEILNRDLDFDPGNIKIIKPGTNLDKFNPKYKGHINWEKFGVPKDAVKALYVGRITKEKNIPFLLKMWEEYIKEKNFPDIYLILIGEGNLKTKAKELYNSNIRYIGPVIGEKLSQFYASSDFFIFPSLTDTLGQVVMESQASALPVIVSDKGGPQGLVNKEKPSGFIIDPKDISKWKDAVDTLYKDKQLRQQMGQNALEGISKLPIEDSFEQFWKYQKEIYDKA